MVWTCSADGGDMTCVQNFGWGNSSKVVTWNTEEVYNTKCDRLLRQLF
jgi:hypothetical protein